MTGALSAAAIAAIAGALGIYLLRKKVWQKYVPYLMLAAGLGLAGMLGGALDWIGQSLVGTTSSVTRTLAGAAVPLVLTFVFGLALVLALKPKGPGVTRWTPWIALVFPAVLVATGGMAGDLGALLNHLFGTATTAALNALGTAIQGAGR